jgi:hypothetical protein
MTLPEAFCWTKFGSEAGETADTIFARKDEERQANDGVFLWGIGNSIGPSLIELLKITRRPRVLFSPMLSQPAPIDCAPTAIATWTQAVGLDGRDFTLPVHSYVTSRWSGRPAHYALVCRSTSSIRPSGSVGRIERELLCNLRTGSAIGSSQVTSVVKSRSAAGHQFGSYSIAAIAELAYPYLLKLGGPELVMGSPEAIAEFEALTRFEQLALV